MPVSALETILPEIAHRYRRVRSGLTVGFDGETAAQTLRDFRGGVWMASEADRELPFDDAQFEVVVVASASVSREMVREANRILVSGGCMFFTVDEKRGGEAPGYTAPEIYRLVREGFDILAVHRLTRPDTVKEHNDPFDRLLLAQAKVENLSFLTHDELISGYEEKCVIAV